MALLSPGGPSARGALTLRFPRLILARGLTRGAAVCFDLSLHSLDSCFKHAYSRLKFFTVFTWGFQQTPSLNPGSLQVPLLSSYDRGMSRTRTLLEQHSVVDLFTLVYVAVDDYLQHSLKYQRFALPEACGQKASYSELMTISLVGDLLAQPYGGNWFVWVKHEYAVLFPSLPDLTRSGLSLEGS